MTPEGGEEVGQGRKFTQSMCPAFRLKSLCKQELERPTSGLTLAATPQFRPPEGDVCQIYPNPWMLEMSKRQLFKRTPSRTQSKRLCPMAITYPMMPGFQWPNFAIPTWKVLRVPGKPNCRWWYIIMYRLTNLSNIDD